MRRYTCVDCPAGACEHEAGARGPLPDRCPAHRAAREARRGRRRRSNLTIVRDDLPTEESAAPTPVPAIQAEVTASAGGGGEVQLLSSIVRSDLDALLSAHPARDTLVALAQRLASAIDSPLAVLDPRAMATVARELRATVADLVDHEEAASDDLFGDDDLPTALVFPKA